MPWGAGGAAPGDAIGDRLWYGVLAYEAGQVAELSAGTRQPPVPQPYIDGFEPENRIVLSGGAVACSGRDARARWDASCGVDWREPPATPAGSHGAPWRSFNADTYRNAVLAARDFIAAGDIYQVNLTLARSRAGPGTPIAGCGR
jgi:anthranilate/para-aminobenzoate synthase component I